jgi:A/G-specific adenine glycosylase
MMTTETLTPAFCKRLRKRLGGWYSRENRCLPWRENRDSYRIWISEAMLQQTRVETVIGYFERFQKRLPSLADLAAASEEEVLSLWSGLGYYSRARKLREAAMVIMDEHGGQFPRTREQALKLPGVGPYTAGAVLSIAYDLPEALVDGNVQRVFARIFALREESGSGPLQKKLWSLAEQLVPQSGGAGDWNQALMELGATVCKPRDPDCASCPVESMCRARELDLVGELPVPKPRRKPTEVRLEILVVEQKGTFLLEKRPSEGRMAGLWQFPTLELEPGGALFPEAFAEAGSGPLSPPEELLGELRHSITRYAIRAQIHRAKLLGKLPLNWKWFTRKELAGAPLTGMARKVLDTRE